MQQFRQFFCLTFIYSSTCFGRPHAHHQELNNCSSSLWFYPRSVVVAVLLVMVGPAGRSTPGHMELSDAPEKFPSDRGLIPGPSD